MSAERPIVLTDTPREGLRFNTEAFPQIWDITLPSLAPSPMYTAAEVLTARSAVKLATKFLRDDVSAGHRFDLTAHSAEIGLLVAMAGAPAEQIAAGILYDAFCAYPHKQKEFGAVLLRKSDVFGPGVKYLIDAALEGPSKIIERHPHAGALAAAVAIADMSLGRQTESTLDHENFIANLNRVGTPPLLINQLELEHSRRLGAGFEMGALYSQIDVVHVRNMIQFCNWVFNDTVRKWGPHEKLPLLSHLAEVGILLAMARRSGAEVVAGIGHDLLENYSDKGTNTLKNTIRLNFGEPVLLLIEASTEPAKDPKKTNWYERKMAVLMHAHEAGPEVTNVVCASKISTVSAGNKMLYSGRPISEWSAGTLEDNLAFFRVARLQFQARGVDPLLLEQFEIELDRMASFREPVNTPRLSKPRKTGT